MDKFLLVVDEYKNDLKVYAKKYNESSYLYFNRINNDKADTLKYDMQIRQAELKMYIHIYCYNILVTFNNLINPIYKRLPSILSSDLINLCDVVQINIYSFEDKFNDLMLSLTSPSSS